jgi:hypothetical protein
VNIPKDEFIQCLAEAGRFLTTKIPVTPIYTASLELEQLPIHEHFIEDGTISREAFLESLHNGMKG